MSRAVNLVGAGVVALALTVSAYAQTPARPVTPSPSIARPLAALAASPLVPEAKSGAKPVTKPVNCRRVKCVALTFDDGPVPQTKAVLDALKKKGARATFFVLGSVAKQHPALLRRMLADGDAIGNHSWDHAMFSRLSTPAIKRELKRTKAVIWSATRTKSHLVRVPYGENNPRLRKAAATSVQSAAVLWSVDTLDWKYRNSATVTRNVMRAVRPGSIVLMHDIHPTTRAAVPGIISRLQAKGYVLVTVEELFNGHLKAGKVYFRR